MRLCPTVESTSAPLITHLIGADVCMSRQRGFYHKCHRCLYRGKAATFELAPDQPQALAVAKLLATVRAETNGEVVAKAASAKA